MVEMADDIAKTSSKTLNKVNEEELRELYAWMLKKEGPSQHTTQRDLQENVEWWSSDGNILDNRKGTSDAASTNSSDHEEDDSIKTAEIASGGGSNNDGETRYNMPDKVSFKRGSEYHEEQSDELGGELLQSKEYLEWKKYPQGLLWLHGNCRFLVPFSTSQAISAGLLNYTNLRHAQQTAANRLYGKSHQSRLHNCCYDIDVCASSSIIKNLGRIFNKDKARTKVLVYWYFRSDVEETKRINIFLVSLIRQLATQCQGFADNKSLKWFRDHQNSGQLPDDPNALFRHLNRFISNLEKDVFIILDGLDEVADRQHKSKARLLKLLDIIKRLMKKGYSNLHLLLASRDEKDIRRSLEENMKDMLVAVNVGRGLGQDLGRFIERKIERLNLEVPLSRGTITRIKERLTHGQDRYFLDDSLPLHNHDIC